MSLRNKELDRLFDSELGPTEEESLFDMVSQMFRGRALHITVMIVVGMFAFLALMIYSGFRFFEATETKDLILWAVLFMYSSMCVGMLKLWTWMDMQRNSVTREIKRLELQIARMRSENAAEGN